MNRFALAALLAVTAAVPARGIADPAPRLPAPPREIAGIPVVLLVDMGSGQRLYAERPARSFLPASMTKVMTAYVAFELMAQGKLRPGQRFTVSPQTAAVWSGHGTSMYLKAGESVSVDELLHGIATASANDAAVVLAQGYAGSVPGWTKLMNAEAHRLGLTDSHFNTPNGWPDNGRTHVSARDLVRLAEAMITRHPALYHRYFGHKRIEWRGMTLTSHDPTVGVVPGADGIKTGHTNEAGYNFLGSARRDGRRLIMVIGGAITEPQRAAASRALLEWGFAAWQARPLFAAGTPVADARVQGGAARSVPLVADRAVHAAVPTGTKAPISLRVAYRGPLVAPIAKGAQVARLEIRVGDLPAGHVPLYAAHAVGEAGPLDRLANGLMHLF